MDEKQCLPQDLKLSIEKPLHLEGDIWLVVCKVDSKTNVYHPLQKPLDTSGSINEYTRKKLWSLLEDQLLVKLVKQKGTKAWSSISREINKIVHNSLNIRQPRQCRERWFNYADPELNKETWTEEEDLVLMEKQKRFGNKWSEIANFLKGRNQNSIKNRWKKIKNDWERNNITPSENQQEIESILSSPKLVSENEIENDLGNEKFNLENGSIQGKNPEFDDQNLDEEFEGSSFLLSI